MSCSSNTHVPSSCAFLSRIREVLLVLDGAGCVQWANERWSELGLHPDDLTGRALVELVVGEGHDALRERLQARQELDGLRVRMPRPPSGSAWVQLTGSWDPDSACWHVVGRDISEDVRTRSELESLAERYQLAMSSTAVGLFDWDLSTGVVQMSEGLARLHDLDRDRQIRMEELQDRWHPQDRPGAREALRKHLCGAPTVEFDVRLDDGDGGWRYVRVEGRSSRDQHGQVCRVVGTVVDETKQVRAMLALEQQVADARRAVAAKDEFLANVSHEIRTPLNAVLGMNELIRQTDLDTHQRELARTVGRAGEALLRLIDDILDLAKVDAGRMELEAIPVDLQELVGQTSELFRGRAVEKGLELTVDVDVPKGTVVRTDPVRLRQVLANLCSNAVKFTEVGAVRIRVQAAPPDESGLTDVCIEVEDTGIGIPEHRLADIFAPFVQADGSTTRRFGGTGLGLTISRSLVERLGGRLDVASVEGAGTVFTVRLRLEVCSHAPSVTGTVSLDEVLPEGIRVFVVEDNVVNQRVVVLMLQRLGCRVAVASDGSEAVARIPDEDPELVFMDVQMPGLDGYEATRRLRGLGCDMPIIGLTAHAMRGDRARCLAAGMDGYETKPIRLDALRRVLMTWVVGPSRQQSAL